MAEQTTSFKIGALGDSISVAFNAEGAGNNDSHSWVTGSGESHMTRIQKLYPALKVEAFNMAFAGATSADLRGQVDRLSQHRPDYVTLMIGANDLTRWMSGRHDHKVQEFSGVVRSAVQRLIAVNPQVMILIAAIPDQSRVVSLFAKSRLGGEFQSILETLMQRPDLQVLIGTYAELRKKANQSLREIATSFSKNVRYAGSPAVAAFEDEHLSTHDRYHPSVLGQDLLAELTWREGFFP